MNYIKKFMKDNGLDIGKKFKMTAYPDLVFYIDDLYYLCLDSNDEYLQENLDRKYILFWLLRGDYLVTLLED